MLLPLPSVLLGGGGTGEGSSHRDRVPLDSKHSSHWSPLAGKVLCPGRTPSNPSSDAPPDAEAPCSVCNSPALTEVTKRGQASGGQAGHTGARETEGSGGQSPLKAHGALCPPKAGHRPQCSLPVGAEQTPLQGRDTKATSLWMSGNNYSCGCPHLLQEGTAKSHPNSPALRVPASPLRHPMAKGHPIPNLPCVLAPTRPCPTSWP